MVDFGSGQGRSEFETAGVALLRRGFQIRENAGLGQKMPFPDGHELGRLPLTWARSYRSQSTYSGQLGPGRQTPADARLGIDDKGLVTFFDGNPGGCAVFEAPPPGEPVIEAANCTEICAADDHYGCLIDMPQHFRLKLIMNTA